MVASGKQAFGILRSWADQLLRLVGFSNKPQRACQPLRSFGAAHPNALRKMRASPYSTAPLKVTGLLPTCYRMASETRISSAELISQYTPCMSFLDAAWRHALVVSWVPNKTENSSRVEPHFFLLLALWGAWLWDEHTGLTQYVPVAVSEVEKQPRLQSSQFISSLWRKRKGWCGWAQVSRCFCILRWGGDVFLRPGLWRQPLRFPFILTLPRRAE